jgi:ABC-type glycerol-3-phosphate transport system substrate-binding protein
MQGGEPALLAAYLFDAELGAGAGIQLTVTALRDNGVLRKAVRDFQRAHPEIDLSLNTALEENDLDTPVEDAVRTLNTDLLAGTGGDVLILDELPLRQYVAKGVLAPLDGALAGIDFLPGVLAGSRAEDGALYAMPARFLVPTLWGSGTAVRNIDSLETLAALPGKE